MSREINYVPPTPQKNRCSSCEYFNSHHRPLTDGCRTSGCVPIPVVYYRCRRNAPGGNGWPEVSQYDSCGEYKELLNQG